MEVRTVEAVVHGRVLYERRSDARLLVGFHGYAENAEKHIGELHKIPGIEEWSVAAIQALHPFYGSRSAGGGCRRELDDAARPRDRHRRQH